MFGLFTFDKKFEIAFKIQFKFSSIMVFFHKKIAYRIQKLLIFIENLMQIK